MKVSVIIPVYNVERYLARCLDSVLAAVREVEKAGGGGRRTDPVSAEIICVNDGSTDGSEKVLQHYRSSFNLQPSTFLVITKPNGGLGSARNAGLDAMTGDYVMFVDSDDWIPSHAITTFVSVAETSKAALVVSTSFLKDGRREPGAGRGAPAVLRPSPFVLRPSPFVLRPSSWISGRKVQYCAWNKLYRADLFATRRYPATIYEDFPVTTDIFCEVGEFAAVEAPLYVYCTNAGATSLVRSTFTERKMRDSLTVVRMTLDQSKGRPREAFARRQAADGLSSTVGQVYKAGDAVIAAAFLKGVGELFSAYPELQPALTLKARFRLWRIRSWLKGAA